MKSNNGEFRGSTKQALKDMSEDIKGLQGEISTLRRWLTVLSILLTVAVIERIPDFVKVMTTVVASN